MVGAGVSRWGTSVKVFAAAIVTAMLAGPAMACELDRPVVFAGLDWDSVAFHNAVARRIVEDGFGCKTDVIPGSTIPLVQGLAQGDVDIAMEIWKDAVTEVWQRALKRGQVVELGINFPDAVQGWYVPRYVADMVPDLKSVTDLARHAHLFTDPEEPAKGRFYNCVAGWSCEIVNTNKLRAYGLDRSFTNFRPGTGAALAAVVAGAVLKREPIVFYYWSPTWLLGSYDFVRLEEPPWNEADWTGLARDPAYPKAVAYPTVEVWIGANKRFAEQAPRLAAFLSKYRTTSDMINRSLARMRQSGGEEDAEARRFLVESREVWQSWLEPDVAARVAAALASK